MEPLHQSGLAAVGASLSIADLFLMADIVVKTVMIALLVISVWTWTVIITKTLLMRRLEAESSVFSEAFWNSSSLEILYQKLADRPKEPMAAIFCAAVREWQMGVNNPGTTNRATWPERVQRTIRVTLEREVTALNKSLTFLAITGSAAPFVGLFGTVWGVMNSFTAIAASKNTSLAVVAPGIAEALFATAIGLFAAIPASIAYNFFASKIERYAGRLDAFGDEITTLLLRQGGTA
ncbi:MAG: protein TolQ [Holosporales bacterium]